MEHNINKHISGRFNQELENVRNHVLNMGGLVEQKLALMMNVRASLLVVSLQRAIYA